MNHSASIGSGISYKPQAQMPSYWLNDRPLNAKPAASSTNKFQFPPSDKKENRVQTGVKWDFGYECSVPAQSINTTRSGCLLTLFEIRRYSLASREGGPTKQAYTDSSST